MVKPGDRLRLKDSNSTFRKGDLFVVSRVLSEGVYALAYKGFEFVVVSDDDIDMLFDRAGRAWSKWKDVSTAWLDYRYRTNGEDTEVCVFDKFFGKSKCHPDDEYNRNLGIDLALQRAIASMKLKYDNDLIAKYGNCFCKE